MTYVQQVHFEIQLMNLFFNLNLNVQGNLKHHKRMIHVFNKAGFQTNKIKKLL